MGEAVTLRELWKRITTTRYTHALEAEVARLRAENRALLNSILGIAGVPPIPVTVPDDSVFRAGALREAPGTVRAAKTGGSRDASSHRNDSSGGVQVAAPMRRRSWHQINRMLELESARTKPVASD
jgi:hypothetical protein